MGEGEGVLGPLGARDDYSHPLRLLEDGEESVNVDLANLRQEAEAEAAPDHCGGRQHQLFILVEPLQAPADDQTNVVRNVDLVDLDVSAELAGRIEDLSLFDQMPVHLLDEERISLAFLKDKAQEIFRSFALA